MRVFVYNMRTFDELAYFERFTEEMGMEMSWTEDSPTIDNCGLADGYDAISVITTPITPEMQDRLKRGGVRMVSTRTIGYDHIDLTHAKDIGMVAAHVTYDPEGVADYCVMMVLAVIRNLRRIQVNNAANDFTLEGLLGRKLRDLTVGIVGAGKIGTTVMRDLSGFGCRVVYTGRRRNEEADTFGEYVDMDTLLRESDVVSLHLELNLDTHHIIDTDAISRMKDGAYLVNTARGPLVDTEALIDALDSGKLSGAALDVIEDEFGLYYNDMRGKDIPNRYMDRLRSMENVLLTHHMAFYYDAAVRDMVYNCLDGIRSMDDDKDIPYRLV